jgi:hypothetical protein
MQFLRQKKLKKITIFFHCIAMLFSFSCSTLNKSQILNSKKTEAISVLELKILFNGVEEKRNSGLIGECHLVFASNSGSVKSTNDDDYSFYVIKTKPGIVKIKALKCSNWIVYFKNRHLSLGDLEFNAKPDHINYLGNLVINYEPRGFGLPDVLGLGGITNDNESSFDIKIYDNTLKSVNFLKEHYPELKNRNVLKSIIHYHKNTETNPQELEDGNKILKQVSPQINLEQENFPINPQNYNYQQGDYLKPYYLLENKQPFATPAIVPAIPAETIPNIAPQSLPRKSSSIYIPEDVANEQILRSPVNNEQKIGRILSNSNHRVIKSPNPSLSPKARVRPSEVQ